MCERLKHLEPLTPASKATLDPTVYQTQALMPVRYRVCAEFRPVCEMSPFQKCTQDGSSRSGWWNQKYDCYNTKVRVFIYLRVYMYMYPHLHLHLCLYLFLYLHRSRVQVVNSLCVCAIHARRLAPSRRASAPLSPTACGLSTTRPTTPHPTTSPGPSLLCTPATPPHRRRSITPRCACAAHCRAFDPRLLAQCVIAGPCSVVTALVLNVRTEAHAP